MAEKKKSTTKAKSARKTAKPTEKKSTTRMRKPKSDSEVQSKVEQVAPQTEIQQPAELVQSRTETQQALEQVKSQTEATQPVKTVKPHEINQSVSEEKTPFTIEIITGIVALITFGLFRQALVIPFIILVLVWRFVLKESIATIVATFFITLVTSSETFDNPYEYLFSWVVIGVVIAIELYFKVVAPIKRGQILTRPGVLDMTFFYVAGVVISFIIQISICGVSLIENGILDLIRIQTQILECQYQGTNIALICIRWIFTAAIFWGSLIVALRRINFDPKNLKRLPGMFLLALLGVIITVLFSAAINTVKIFIADEYNLPQVILVTYSYLYTITTILLASIGASFATKRFTRG